MHRQKGQAAILCLHVSNKAQVHKYRSNKDLRRSENTLVYFLTAVIYLRARCFLFLKKKLQILISVFRQLLSTPQLPQPGARLTTETDALPWREPTEWVRRKVGKTWKNEKKKKKICFKLHLQRCFLWLPKMGYELCVWSSNTNPQPQVCSNSLRAQMAWFGNLFQFQQLKLLKIVWMPWGRWLCENWQTGDDAKVHWSSLYEFARHEFLSGHNHCFVVTWAQKWFQITLCPCLLVFL